MGLPENWHSLLCLLTVAALGGCASATKPVHPRLSVPTAGAGERAANVSVSAETPQQLVAQGFVRIGTRGFATRGT